MESQTYPFDRFSREYKEAMAASRMPSVSEIQEAVVALLENIDSVPGRFELWPLFMYIRMRLQANDVPLNYLLGSGLQSIHEAFVLETKVLEISSDQQVLNIYRKLLEGEKIFSRNQSFSLKKIYCEKAFLITLATTFFSMMKQEKLGRFLSNAESVDAAFRLFLSSITGFHIDVLENHQERQMIKVRTYLYFSFSHMGESEDDQTAPIEFYLCP